MPQFIILADDYKDADALSRRLAVREQHLARAHDDKTKGVVLFGGAKLNEENTMVGSMIVVELANADAVREWCNEDPYVKGRVWENIEIIPFRLANV